MTFFTEDIVERIDGSALGVVAVSDPGCSGGAPYARRTELIAC